jgi:hypothetical protein
MRNMIKSPIVQRRANPKREANLWLLDGQPHGPRPAMNHQG